MFLPRAFLSGSTALAVGAYLLIAAPAAVNAAPPAASVSTYAVIGSLPVGTPTSQIHIAGGTTATTTDDTIYVGTDGALVVYPPLAATGTTGTSIAVSGKVTRMASGDDTLYLALSNSLDDSLAAFPLTATSGAPAIEIALVDVVSGLAVGGVGTSTTADDTVYIVDYNGPTGVISFTSGLDDSTVTLFNAPTFRPGSVIVSGGDSTSTSDDTVYVGGNRTGGNTIIQLSPDLDDSSNLPTTVTPGRLALFDDSLIFGSSSGVRAINLLDFDDSAAFPLYTGSLAVNKDGAIAAMYIYYPSPSQQVPMPIINAAGMSALASLNLGIPSPGEATPAAASDGVFYLAAGRLETVLQIDRVDAGSMSPTSGGFGATVTLPFTTGSSRLVDDSTVQAVWWGSTSVPFTRVVGQNAVEIQVPNIYGSVDVTVELNGGTGLSMGTFAGPPNPTPIPASAPESVSAMSGDQQVEVSWQPPASSGSFPVTNYQAQTEDKTGDCLVAASDDTTLSCTIEDLVNEQEYRVRVRALTGAGWGAWSDYSEPVTPAPAPRIVITGTRDGREVRVLGATAALVGAQVTPWYRFPGPHRYSAGVGVRTVAADGRFTWQRETGKRIYVYFRAQVDGVDTGIRSNRVIIQAR